LNDSQVAERAVAKIRRLRPDCLQSDNYLEVRRTVGNSLLDPTDVISQVLKDGDFILIGQSASSFIREEITI
jgi:hypothetical protein